MPGLVGQRVNCEHIVDRALVASGLRYDAVDAAARHVAVKALQRVADPPLEVRRVRRTAVPVELDAAALGRDVEELAGDALAVDLHGTVGELRRDGPELVLEVALMLVHDEAQAQKGGEDEDEYVAHVTRIGTGGSDI
jgi:hypothetical protein